MNQWSDFKPCWTALFHIDRGVKWRKFESRRLRTEDNHFTAHSARPAFVQKETNLEVQKDCWSLWAPTYYAEKLISGMWILFCWEWWPWCEDLKLTAVYVLSSAGLLDKGAAIRLRLSVICPCCKACAENPAYYGTYVHNPGNGLSLLYNLWDSDVCQFHICSVAQM